ncbi:MAG: hypothetical protein A2097_09040 [Desulfobacula sp. GWF2_41_7]|nr:MAG: hypothetical protein A2097_09040 [Desulfobacula sp. GWF2_41_7]
MHQSGLNEGQDVVIGMNEFFQIIEGALHFFYGRRYEMGIVRPRASNPILAFAEFSRVGEMSCSRASHQLLVEFAQKTQNKWKSFQPRQAVV